MGIHRKRTEALLKASDDGSAKDSVLSLAYGTCCDAGCILRERAREAQERGEAMPTAEGTFVLFTCTSKNCNAGGQMHSECYERKMKQLFAVLRARHVSGERSSAGSSS